MRILLFTLLATFCVAQNVTKCPQSQGNPFRAGQGRNVTLFLGESGVGISTLTLLLTGAELTCKKDDVFVKGIDTTYSFYRVYDQCGKIGHESFLSRTMLPELMIDHKSGAMYYDCPGYRNAEIGDETVTHLLKKVLRSVDSFKIVVLVNDYMGRSEFDPYKLERLMKKLVVLLEDIDEYADGIALVINRVIDTPESEFLRTRNQYIRYYANELKKMNGFYLQQLLKRWYTEEERKSMIEQNKLIETFLLRSPGSPHEYERIQLFHEVKEVGPLNEMQLVQDETRAIQKMINENIRFVQRDPNNTYRDELDKLIDIMSDPWLST